MEEEQEQEMRVEFRKQAEVLVGLEDRFLKDGNTLLVGLESEIAIDCSDIPLGDIEGVRNKIIQEVPEVADVELGAAQIEFRTPPIDLLAADGVKQLTSVYNNNFALIMAAAKRQRCHIIRVGANPFLPIKNTPRTSKPKYQLVPDFYNTHRSNGMDTLIGLGREQVDVGDAAVVSLFQSFQINIEARSFADACDKMNRSFFIAPYLLAFSANARFLEFLDTRMHDLRLLAWEKSHDTRFQDLRLLSWEKTFDIRTQAEILAGYALRVGLPEKYFMEISAYLKRAGSFPFILYQPAAALNIAIGMHWLDARTKFIGDSAVVELRLLSTQPTIEEELMLTLLYIGRLYDSQFRNEKLLPIEFVRENRLAAMLYGTKRDMWFISDKGETERLPYRIGVIREIQRAKNGLRRFGLLSALDNGTLAEILDIGPPSERLAREYEKIGLGASAMRWALENTKMLI